MTKQEKAQWESLTGRPIENPNEFFMGQMDCKEGNPEKQGMGECYLRGYAAQYQLEQIKSQLTERSYETLRTN